MSNSSFSADTTASPPNEAEPLPLQLTPPSTPPPVVRPVTNAPPKPVPGGGAASVSREPASRNGAVPPPPPTRATLPPIRSAASRAADAATFPEPSELAVISGVGSAKTGRWGGELPPIQVAQSRSAAKSVTADGQDRETSDQSEESPPDKVNRAATVPSWLVSMVLHLVLLLILALITTPVGSGISRVLLTMGQSERQSPVELAEFSIDPADQMTESDSIEDAPIEVDMDSLMSEVMMDVPVPMAIPGQSESGDVSTQLNIAAGAAESIAEMKPMFGGRSGAMRKALLAMFGGTQQTEDAVKLGLEWLKAQQQKNGSWSLRGPYGDGGTSENNTAATAMALLAYMGAGNTHPSGDYPDEVRRGIKWLVGQQDRRGFMAKSARDHEQMYAQAQAMIAICELYAMTGDSWLRAPAQLAIDFAVETQSPEGGWRYEPGFDSDTSVTGWFVMGLKSGVSAGLDVPQKTFYRIEDYLDSVQSYDGAAYGYQRRRDATPAMTAEGLLCRQYLGWRRNVPAMAVGLETLVEGHMLSTRDRDVYYWYYATQALHHYGGPLWTQWNDVMKVELPASQVKSGREKGSWSPQQDDWGPTAGRLYTTCLSIYCLEVYYRHMPLYSQEE